MARKFVASSSQYLSVLNAPVTGPPFSVAGWFQHVSNGAGYGFLSIGDESATDYFFLRKVAWGAPSFTAYSGGTEASAYASLNPPLNTWNHLCAVAAATNSRAVYVNGGNKGTNAVDLSPSDIDRMGIGVRISSSPVIFLDGQAAEVGIWNVALTDAEVAILAKGYSPLLVRPESLVFYLPLVRDEDRDIVGGLTLTPYNSPTVEVHPRVLYPSAWWIGFSSGEAPPPPTLSASVQDAISVSDSPSAVIQTSPREAITSDSIAADDSPLAIVAIGVSVQDALSIDESVTGIVPVPMSTSDNISVADSPSADILAPAIREPAASDSVSLNESLSGSIAVLTVSVEDGVSLQDAPLGEIGIAASFSESIALADDPSAEVLSAAIREATASDSISLNESVAGSIPSLACSVQDAVSLEESVLATIGVAIVIDDTIAVSDEPSASVLAATPREAIGSDSIALDESAAGTLNIAPSIQDAVGLDENTATTISAAASVEDSVALDESVSALVMAAAAREAITSDEVSADDNTLVTPLSLVVADQDSVGIEDEPIVALSTLATTIQDTISIEDAPEADIQEAIARSASASDTVSLDESSVAEIVTLPTVSALAADEIVIEDQASAQIAVAGTVTDAISLDDILEIEPLALSGATEDELGIEDTPQAAVITIASAQDAIALLDEITIYLSAGQASVEEFITLLDLTSALVPVAALAEDAVATEEDVAVEFFYAPLLAALEEAINVTGTVYITNKNLYIDSSESINLLESLLGQMRYLLALIQPLYADVDESIAQAEIDASIAYAEMGSSIFHGDMD